MVAAGHPHTRFSRHDEERLRRRVEGERKRKAAKEKKRRRGERLIKKKLINVGKATREEGGGQVGLPEEEERGEGRILKSK